MRVNTMKNDWLFIWTFYLGGMVLLVWGLSTKYSGAGLFGAVFGLVCIGTAAYHIKLEEYR